MFLLFQDIYPNIDKSGENRVIQFFEEVAERSLELVARWQGYGFTHGVLNTDNMSLLGITIDYGPYGFVEAYDTQYTPNHSDNLSRYCLGNQPNVKLIIKFIIIKYLLIIMFLICRLSYGISFNWLLLCSHYSTKNNRH